MVGAALVPLPVLGLGSDVQHAVVPRDVDIVDVEAGELHTRYELPVFLVQFVVVTACFEELSWQV